MICLQVENGRALPRAFCDCSSCRQQIRGGEGLACGLAPCSGQGFTGLVFCVHRRCRAAFEAERMPPPSWRWETFDLSDCLTALLTSTSKLAALQEKATVVRGH